MSSSGIRVGGAFVELSLVATKLNSDLIKYSDKIDKFCSDASKKAKDRLAFGITLSAPVALAVKTFADFDDQMRIVQAVSGATEQSFNQLTEQAKKLGATTSFTAAQVASAMGELGRSGFSSNQISQSIAEVMNLARATATDVPVATDIASNALRAFGLETSEMSRVCDVLTATANGSAQTLEDLGEALKYVAPIAAQTGLSLEDTAKIVGALANFGIKGSMAGTAFKNIQTRMVDPAVQKKYADLGVSTTNSDGSLRGVADVLADVASATANMPNAEKLGAFKELFGMFGIAGGAALTSGADFKALFDAIDGASGSAERAATAMDEGLGGAIRITQSAVEGLAIAVGDALAPFLSDLGNKIQKVAEVLANFASKHQGLITWAASSAAKLAAMNAGMYVGYKTLQIFANKAQLAGKVISGLNTFYLWLTGATKAQTAATIAQEAVVKAKTAADAAALAFLQATTAAEKQATLSTLQDSVAKLKAAESTAAATAANVAYKTSTAACLTVATAAIAVVGALAAAFVIAAKNSQKASDAAKTQSDKALEQAEANKTLREEHQRLFDRLEELANKEALSNEEFAEGCSIAAQLKDAYGDLGIQIDETTKSFKGMTDAKKAFDKAALEGENKDLEAENRALDAESKTLEREQENLFGDKKVGFGRTIASWFGGKSVDQRYDEIKNRQAEIREKKLSNRRKIDANNARLQGMQQDAAEKNQAQAAGVKYVGAEELAAAGKDAAAIEKEIADEQKTPHQLRIEKAQERQAKYIAAQKTMRDAAIQRANGDQSAIARANAQYNAATLAAGKQLQKTVEKESREESTERLQAAAKALEEATKSGDAVKLEQAQSELDAAKEEAGAFGVDERTIQEIIDGATEANQTVEESAGTFDAFEAFDWSQDWRRTEMQKQTAALEDVKEGVQTVVKHLQDDEDMI